MAKARRDIGKSERDSNMNYTEKLKETISRLRAYNRWRRGDDERSFDELGISTKQIGLDIEFICDEMEKEIEI